MYLVKTPALLKKIYHRCVWEMPANEKIIYLTFDDGPHPTATPFVLNCLKEYNAKATFFCIGKNVVEHPDVYQAILENGHRAGNHTHNHMNGWKVSDKEYFDNIFLAAKYIDSNLFRPPYGRISLFQSKHLSSVSAYNSTENPFKIIMWSVLSGDFDTTINGKETALNVINHAKAGSIVVFHDSEKAYPRMTEALPKTLAHFSKLGYRFESIIM